MELHMLIVGLHPGNIDYMIFSRRASFIVIGVFGTLVVGTASVHATPACQQLVRIYREKMVRNPVSPSTQERWRAWNKNHPNFRPKPRPQYKMTSEEVARKMDFDCQVPVDPVMLAMEIPPQMPGPPPADLFPPPTPRDVVPTKPGPNTALPSMVLGAPPTPANIAPVPEPSSVVFLLTGLVFLVTQTGASKIKT
jgi:hypothetical protein